MIRQFLSPPDVFNIAELVVLGVLLIAGVVELWRTCRAWRRAKLADDDFASYWARKRR